MVRHHRLFGMADINKKAMKYSRMLNRNSGCTTSLYTVVFAALFVVGCCPCRKIQNIATQTTQDSAVSNTRVETRTEYVTDTVYIEIPSQTAERTTVERESYLENDYAETAARINGDGTLYHDLRSKEQKFPSQIKTQIVYKDSIRTEYRYANIYIDKPYRVEVERSFTWWQKTCIKFFPIIIISLIAYIVIRNRKTVFSFIRRLIG